MKYVCGFAFGAPQDRALTPGVPLFEEVPAHVPLTPMLLIRKVKPDWQRGKLNGIGGKIELGESPRGAMAREFREETTLITQPEEWSTFHHERFRSGNEVYFLYHSKMWLHELRQAEEKTMLMDEPVEVVWMDDWTTLHVPSTRLLYNIRYLASMAVTTARAALEDQPI